MRAAKFPRRLLRLPPSVNGGDDQPRTSLITPDGTYRYLRMPFGQRNVCATFARLVQIVFQSQAGPQPGSLCGQHSRQEPCGGRPSCRPPGDFRRASTTTRRNAPSECSRASSWDTWCPSVTSRQTREDSSHPEDAATHFRPGGPTPNGPPRRPQPLHHPVSGTKPSLVQGPPRIGPLSLDGEAAAGLQEPQGSPRESRHPSLAGAGDSVATLPQQQTEPSVSCSSRNAGKQTARNSSWCSTTPKPTPTPRPGTLSWRRWCTRC